MKKPVTIQRKCEKCGNFGLQSTISGSTEKIVCPKCGYTITAKVYFG